jgi:hypothetical protein
VIRTEGVRGKRGAGSARIASATLGAVSGRAPLAFALVLVACRAPAPAPVRGPSGPVAKEVETTPGTTLTSACTPTGVERCFDAVDDNCNGIIDEGCGVHTGLLQFAIAWDDGPDVDLLVTDPGGELARAGEATASGLHKDRDCGASDDGCHGQNLENVYFDGAEPPRGRYRVQIKVERADPSQLPVHVRFGARVGPRTYGTEVELAGADDTKTFAFTL